MNIRKSFPSCQNACGQFQNEHLKIFPLFLFPSYPYIATHFTSTLGQLLPLEPGQFLGGSHSSHPLLCAQNFSFGEELLWNQTNIVLALLYSLLWFISVSFVTDKTLALKALQSVQNGCPILQLIWLFKIFHF